MQLQSQSDQTEPAGAQRELVHHLRNLFSVVVSAKQMFERERDDAERAVLLDVIEDAARRGSELTTGLLDDHRDADVATIDIGARLSGLRVMIGALAGDGIRIDFHVDPSPALVRIVPADFDAALLELVRNAAVAGATRLGLRLRIVGARAWIVIADNGRGMSATALDHARSGADAGHAHGAGLCRVRHFLRAAHGQFLIRSRQGAGTTICMTLPLVLHRTADGSGAPDGRDPLNIGDAS
ncbi:sensor histidine kinase [Sphingobium nicotianae]|uniref:histidine kinase n=1 Tax=Sphingobium nicotianae TaxID=2782607 RepID=A0A9X1DDU1_9SPHN|nr:HAMP domain-containing sensor histidine kinase [Sphingobium nicotianae]MBT2188357.1 HAMP domain-containing histidine kinase [Sphingobium nicotianae]